LDRFKFGRVGRVGERGAMALKGGQTRAF
jgi:hypothetical protein